jgi:hypothetical protein
MAKGRAVLRIKFLNAKAIIAQLRAELLRLKADARR